jgi:TonB family protein
VYPEVIVSSIRRLATLWLLLGSLCPELAQAADPASTNHRTIITRIPPVYPELARRMRLTGTVTLRIVVQPNGTVSETHIESGHPILGAAAQEAITRWRFSTGPDPITMHIDVVFDQHY